MLAIKDQPAIDLIRKHQNIAVANSFRDVMNLPPVQNAAGRILRRIQNNQLGLIGNQRRQLVHIQAEIPVFSQTNRYCSPVQITNHGFINREPRVRVNDFISRINKSEHREENNRLAAWNNHHFITAHFDRARLAHAIRNRLPQLRQSGRRSIVGPPLPQAFDAGLYNVFRSIEVGLANFQVDDLLALALERSRFVEHLESGLGAQP